MTVKATVGETSTYYTPDRQGEAFAVDIPVPIGAGEVTTDLEINAVRFDSEQDLDLVKTVTGTYTTSSQPMTYDADGNLLTWDGWLFTWNGENRLIRAEKGLLKIEADYDYMGRRFEKKVYNGETLTSHQRFIYDGYKLIEIRDALNENALETAYFWQPQSLDVPIAMKQGTTLGFYQYDGNKNITGIKAQDGTTLAEYTYGPFGQTLSATGDWAAVNPFRFSSEYHDEETGLVYYNYRHYSPQLGRWLSRDPIEEDSGINLYNMVGNNPIAYFDELGLKQEDKCCINWFTEDVILSNAITSYSWITHPASGLDFKFTSTVKHFTAAELNDAVRVLYAEATPSNIEELKAIASVMFNRVNKFNGGTKNFGYSLKEVISDKSEFISYGGARYTSCSSEKVNEWLDSNRECKALKDALETIRSIFIENQSAPYTYNFFHRTKAGAEKQRSTKDKDIQPKQHGKQWFWTSSVVSSYRGNNQIYYDSLKLNQTNIVNLSLKTYSVEKGDTPNSLSKQWYGYSISNALFQSWNPGVNPSKLKIGQEINMWQF